MTFVSTGKILENTRQYFLINSDNEDNEPEIFNLVHEELTLKNFFKFYQPLITTVEVTLFCKKLKLFFQKVKKF